MEKTHIMAASNLTEGIDTPHMDKATEGRVLESLLVSVTITSRFISPSSYKTILSAPGTVHPFPGHAAVGPACHRGPAPGFTRAALLSLAERSAFFLHLEASPLLYTSVQRSHPGHCRHSSRAAVLSVLLAVSGPPNGGGAHLLRGVGRAHVPAPTALWEPYGRPQPGHSLHLSTLPSTKPGKVELSVGCLRTTATGPCICATAADEARKGHQGRRRPRKMSSFRVGASSSEEKEALHSAASQQWSNSWKETGDT